MSRPQEQIVVQIYKAGKKTGDSVISYNYVEDRNKTSRMSGQKTPVL